MPGSTRVAVPTRDGHSFGSFESCLLDHLDLVVTFQHFQSGLKILRKVAKCEGFVGVARLRLLGEFHGNSVDLVCVQCVGWSRLWWVQGVRGVQFSVVFIGLRLA